MTRSFFAERSAHYLSIYRPRLSGEEPLAGHSYTNPRKRRLQPLPPGRLRSKGWSLRLQGFVSDAASQGFPCELMMKGPARFTALANPCSFLNLTSQSRWTFANASGAFPL